MRIFLLLVLFLNVLGLAASRLNEALEARQALIAKFDDSEKKYLADVRDSLLYSLEANNNEESLRYVEILKDSSFKDFALDKYELLQIYFLTNSLDSAIVTFVRDYDNHLMPYAENAYAHAYQWYSAFDDKLVDYLDSKMDLTKREVLQEQLNRFSNSDVSQEFKDLARLMKREFMRNVVKSKSVACFSEEMKKGRMPEVCEKRDEIYQMRYGVWSNDFVEKDSVFYDSLLSMYASFENEYPDSEFRSWAIKHGIIRRRNRESYNSYKYYYRERFYTGGIGGEYFYGPSNSSFELNVVLQYKRFILSASYAQDDDFLYGWNVLLGADVFENKYFKVVPFVGGYDPWMAGLQLEFRPWISEMGHDAPIGGYLSFKAKYVFKYGENGCEAGTGKDGVLRCYVDGAPTGRDSEKKLAKHRFYLGVGFHLW